MLVENAFEAAVDDRAHDLLDRAFPRQRREDHRIVEISAQSLPTKLDQLRITCWVKNRGVMP
jgi:hypothetical protein